LQESEIFAQRKRGQSLAQIGGGRVSVWGKEGGGDQAESRNLANVQYAAALRKWPAHWEKEIPGRHSPHRHITYIDGRSITGTGGGANWESARRFLARDCEQCKRFKRGGKKMWRFLLGGGLRPRIAKFNAGFLAPNRRGGKWPTLPVSRKREAVRDFA